MAEKNVKNLENPYNTRILTIFKMASFLSIRPKCSGLKRCRSKNPRFSRVFFVFRRFPALCLRSAAFLKIRILVQTKRCQTPISTLCAESDWWNAISGRFSESFSLKKTALFSFFTKNIVIFLCLRKEVLRIVYIYKKEDCDCNY